MAARPYFTGNYGSPLMSNQAAAMLVADQGAKTGQMYAQAGKDIGGVIKEYGLNKQKRAKLTGEIEAYYEQNPEALSQIGMSGDEAKDKKDFTERERFVKGDMNMAQLEGYAGKLARGEVLRSKKLQDDTRRTLNETNKFNLGLAQELKDTTIKLETNKGLTSDIQLTLARMNKEDWEKIRDPALKEKLMQFRDAAGVRAADPLSVRARDARKSRGLQIDAAEQAKQTSNAIIEAWGGLDKFAESEVAGVKLNQKKMQASLDYMASLGETGKLNAMAKLATAGYVDVAKEFGKLHSERGQILDTVIDNPMGGPKITFKEYLDLNVEEGDSDYPLTGRQAGIAETLNGRFKALGLKEEQLYRDTPVQVDDGQGATGDPPPAPIAVNASQLGQQTPQQALQGIAQRMEQIRRRLPQINEELQNLGQPGQTTPTAWDTSPFGDMNKPLAVRPQTVGDIQKIQIDLPQEQERLQKELQELEAQQIELNNLIRVR